jgi:hypothetical protein
MSRSQRSGTKNLLRPLMMSLRGITDALPGNILMSFPFRTSSGEPSDAHASHRHYSVPGRGSYDRTVEIWGAATSLDYGTKHFTILAF